MKNEQFISKSQCTQNVRGILNSYGVDLDLLQFSATQRTVFLSGVLLKQNGYDIPAHSLVEMIGELSRFGSIISNLTNWYISLDEIQYLGVDEVTGHNLTAEAA